MFWVTMWNGLSGHALWREARSASTDESAMVGGIDTMIASSISPSRNAPPPPAIPSIISPSSDRRAGNRSTTRNSFRVRFASFLRYASADIFVMGESYPFFQNC